MHTTGNIQTNKIQVPEQAQILKMKRCEVTAFVNKNDDTLLLKWHDYRTTDTVHQCICLHKENIEVKAVNVLLSSEGGHVEGVIICNLQQEKQALRLITLLTERMQLVKQWLEIHEILVLGEPAGHHPAMKKG